MIKRDQSNNLYLTEDIPTSLDEIVLEKTTFIRRKNVRLANASYKLGMSFSHLSLEDPSLSSSRQNMILLANIFKF